MSYRYGGKTRPGSQVSGWLPAGGFNVNLISPSLWLDASDASTLTSSGSPATVSQWSNKGSISANFTQATAANQPTTGASTQNGLNVLDFDGNDYLNSSVTNDWKFLHDGTVWFLCAVLVAGSTSDPNAAYGYIGNSAASITNIGSAVFFEDRTAATTNNAPRIIISRGVSGNPVCDLSMRDLWTPNQWTVVTHLCSPSASIALDKVATKINSGNEYRNNTLANAASTSNPTYALQIGALGNNSFPFAGKIAEIIVVSGTNATQTNRDGVIAYLNKKWAVF